jgi:hypothetical protein
MVKKRAKIGVVIPGDLKRRLKRWQDRERRMSLSEMCALLLEYAAQKLEHTGSLSALLAETSKRREFIWDISAGQAAVVDGTGKKEPFAVSLTNKKIEERASAETESRVATSPTRVGASGGVRVPPLKEGPKPVRGHRVGMGRKLGSRSNPEKPYGM